MFKNIYIFFYLFVFFFYFIFATFSYYFAFRYEYLLFGICCYCNFGNFDNFCCFCLHLLFSILLLFNFPYSWCHEFPITTQLSACFWLGLLAYTWLFTFRITLLCTHGVAITTTTATRTTRKAKKVWKMKQSCGEIELYENFTAQQTSVAWSHIYTKTRTRIYVYVCFLHAHK